jgi:hypothetical protein
VARIGARVQAVLDEEWTDAADELENGLISGDPEWAHLGLNQGPLACEASALPLSYAPGRTERIAAERAATLGEPGRARWGVSGSLNPKSAPAGPNAVRGRLQRDQASRTWCRGSGSAHWEHPNRVRSGRKQR